MKKKRPPKKKYSYIPWQEVIALMLVAAVALFFAFGTKRAVSSSSGYCPPETTDDLSACFSIITNDSRVGWPLDYYRTSSASDPELDQVTGITTRAWNGYRLASDAMFFALISAGLTFAGLAVMHAKKR